MTNIALVTPVKDEIDNLPKLFDSVTSQTKPIYLWVFIENDSSDGSKEYLEKVSKLKNVDNTKIINFSFSDKSYDIGHKYSKVINKGFEYLKNSKYYQSIDYIGILDADSFPEENYFEKLITTLDRNKVGLTSGVLYYKNGKRENVNKKQIRGSGRMWTKQCFEMTGDFYGLSPDSTTKVKAIINGWQPQVTKNARFISREVNSRGNLEFRGRSAYYNGYTVSYIILKSLYYLFINPKYSLSLIMGYFNEMFSRVDKNPDNEIVEYNKNYLIRNFKKKLLS